jgi:hypothetical protein
MFLRVRWSVYLYIKGEKEEYEELHGDGLQYVYSSSDMRACGSVVG